eukprot:sb/3477063/
MIGLILAGCVRTVARALAWQDNDTLIEKDQPGNIFEPLKFPLNLSILLYLSLSFSISLFLSIPYYSNIKVPLPYPTHEIMLNPETRYSGHVTGYQPISDQYFLIRSVPVLY